MTNRPAAQPTEMNRDDDARLKITISLLDSLQKQDFENIRQALVLPVRAALSANVLAEIYNKSLWMTGPIESFSNVECHTNGYFPTTKALVNFQKATFGFVVRFGPRNSVVGFNLQQPVLLDLPTPWIVPSYVNEETFEENSIRINPFWLFPGVDALLAIPRSPGKKAAVLFLQGSGIGDLDASIGFQKPAKDFAWGLASAGVIVLRIGKPLLWTVYRQKIAQCVTPDDEYLYPGLEALRMLARHPQVDSERIYVAGISMGGRYAPRLCQHSPISIAGMISLAGPAENLASSLISQNTYYQEHFPKDKPEFDEEMSKLQRLSQGLKDGSLTTDSKDPIATLPFGIPLSYFLHDDEHSPTLIVKDLKLRILVMQGELDWQVDSHNNVKAWQEALKDNDQACIKVYAGLCHTFVPVYGTRRGLKQYDVADHVPERVILDIVEWVNNVS